MKLKILVVIPTYNCAQQISRVIREFDNNLLDRLSKVIIVDNISSDNTVAAAKNAIERLGTKKIEIWKNKQNYNLGGTHKVAFLAGERMNMDYVAILHGDNQAATAELNNLIDIAEEQPELGAILGCRFMKGSKLTGYSWQRIWGNRAINAVYSLAAMRLSKDLGSGLNLYRLKDLADHRYLGFGDTITFNIDLLLDYYRKKTRIKFTPISWKEEDQVSNARNFRVGSTAIKKLFWWRINKNTLSPHKPSEYVSSRVK
ncbi:MAG: glycosyltransferase family 2 protein [Candidatus Saccharimonadales bacterium]|jgi:dolichol-phosphate mannosyltransferase